MGKSLFSGYPAYLDPGGRGWGGGGVVVPIMDGEAPTERGTLFTLEVYKRVGISRVEVKKLAGKTVIQVLKGTFEISRTDTPNG